MSKRIRVNGFLFFSDALRSIVNALDKGVTVTKYVLENKETGQPALEFEIRVTCIGKTSVPRTTNLASKS